MATDDPHTRTTWSGGAAAREDDNSFTPGVVLAERYRIDRALARGGMGEVYAASDLALGIEVALKTIRSHLTRNELALKRFKAEVLLARAISHPGVCRIHDLGSDRSRGEAVWFLTMELLAGRTLADYMRNRAPLTPEDVLPLLRQMAEALDAAHAAGVVHRDFKSGNVMLVPDGGHLRVVITDFGVARAIRAGGPGAELDEPGRAVGTPAYISPEQLLGEDAEPSSDIYALGVVLFELLTGRFPFHGDTPEHAIYRRIEDKPPSPRNFAPDLDPRWEAVVLRCLEREPEQRFARATDLLRSLEGQPSLALAVRGRNTLPAERDRFIGRDAELTELARLSASGARLITLLGPAGAGKTRLAARFARQAPEAWPGGVWFADLKDAKRLDGLASAVATALDVPLAASDPITQLGHAIAAKGDCLIVLDNFEQVVSLAPDSLGRWLDRAPGARFFVTSRVRLHLEGETVLFLGTLPEEPALALFVERAHAAHPGFALTAANEKATRELVRLLDGLPLALELAAARVRVLTPEQLVQNLSDRFRVLAGGKGGARHASLRAALDASFDLLRAEEKAALAQLAVFEGGFTLADAERVVDLGSGATWIVDLLQGLVDHSLLSASARDEARFRMLASVQDYARMRLVESGAEQATEARHGETFAARGGEEALATLERHGSAQSRRRLAAELDNLMAGLNRALARGDARAAAGCYRAVWAVLELRGPYRVGVELGERVAALGGLSRRDRAHILFDLGRAYWSCGELARTQAHHQAALELARAEQVTRLEGRLIVSLAVVVRNLGRQAEAIEGLESAIVLARNTGDRALLGITLSSLCLVRAFQGDLEQGRELALQAIELSVEAGDRRAEALAQTNLALALELLGQHDAARAAAERALAISHELGDRWTEATLLANLAVIGFQNGEREIAVERMELALTIHREGGSRRNEASSLGNLGHMLLETGELVRARDCLSACVAIFREIGDRRQLGIWSASLGLLESREGRDEAARAAFASAESLLRELGDRTEIAKLLCRKAEHALRLGERAEAEAGFAEAAGVLEATGAGPNSELGRQIAALRSALGLA